MMQAANDRKLDDLAHVRGLDTSGVRGVLAERQMRPARVIVLGDECSQQSSEMLLAEHDDVPLGRLRQVRYLRNPARCHSMTVAGFTMISESCHLPQNRG